VPVCGLPKATVENKEAKHRIVERTTSLIYTALTSKILFVVPRDSLLKTDEKLPQFIFAYFFNINQPLLNKGPDGTTSG
jgi:hypothetical protein